VSVHVGTGRLRRRCPDCGVEVDVAKPDVKLDAETSRSQRKLYSDAIRGQVCWPALCAQCSSWWNGLVRKILERPSERPEGMTDISDKSFPAARARS
jgi:hypothetical protein